VKRASDAKGFEYASDTELTNPAADELTNPAAAELTNPAADEPGSS
jgi:hypothetical protein